MADPRGFLRYRPRGVPTLPGQVDERVHDWHEVYRDDVGRVLLPIVTRPGGTLHGLRHPRSATKAARWAT